jgi:hypothetical protein
MIFKIATNVISKLTNSKWRICLVDIKMINNCNFYENLHLRTVEVVEYKSDVKIGKFEMINQICLPFYVFTNLNILISLSI